MVSPQRTSLSPQTRRQHFRKPCPSRVLRCGAALVGSLLAFVPGIWSSPPALADDRMNGMHRRMCWRTTWKEEALLCSSAGCSDPLDRDVIQYKGDVCIPGPLPVKSHTVHYDTRLHLVAGVASG
ncbi:hypothetical protein GSI_11881 [Ganoderma sinense ZZ0214-1]|uniref:Uncharacterized protein n=1 Tax=Ganoderma sinense ZZ0214-1 TaxID=1077348 RepID=A0A2G8RX84_9APHY|nr:hypothetical protein GSI_11881 [Ganoderma sinense ZZ0214-1]